MRLCLSCFKQCLTLKLLQEEVHSFGQEESLQWEESLLWGDSEWQGQDGSFSRQSEDSELWEDSSGSFRRSEEDSPPYHTARLSHRSLKAIISYC